MLLHVTMSVAFISNSASTKTFNGVCDNSKLYLNWRKTLTAQSSSSVSTVSVGIRRMTGGSAKSGKESSLVQKGAVTVLAGLEG